MIEGPRKFPTKIAMGCVAFAMLPILFVCWGPGACHFIHEQGVKSEFRKHRGSYEFWVRQIESDILPANRTEVYLMPKDRYSGNPALKRLMPGDGLDDWDVALFEGRHVSVETWNGQLTVKFSLRVTWGLLGLPAECGIAYCSGGHPNEGAEERLKRFEERWWIRWRSLAH